MKVSQPPIPSQFTEAAETKPTPEEDPQLKQVARNFESLFVDQLVTAMRKTVTHSGLIPESQGEKIYQSMLDSKYSQQIADSDQIGLSKMIYDSLLRSR